jgi:hypothetical protein
LVITFGLTLPNSKLKTHRRHILLRDSIIISYYYISEPNKTYTLSDFLTRYFQFKTANSLKYMIKNKNHHYTLYIFKLQLNLKLILT